ncbi:hypothetical protein LSI01_04340 [Furfurilactobacillus siliginis]|uniref:Uncharacterized protein n=1 Tax=Furfurilactobacillus siliginis TaxID=348151 RepID=A0A510VMF2_9LACO|nr:hypothetical protein LSI01_04340 [Furfurilactobacillus siliginis]
MINTNFGYITKQEASVICNLDKRNSKPKRCLLGRRFSMPKARVWRKDNKKNEENNVLIQLGKPRVRNCCN